MPAAEGGSTAEGQPAGEPETASGTTAGEEMQAAAGAAMDEMKAAAEEMKSAAESAVASATGSGGRDPAEIYQTYCQACHVAGVAGAPKLGDSAAWAARVDKGMDTLLSNAVNGINAMPPKGTCNNCSREELRATIDWMIGQSQ
jgi:cytochrome c5